jgi:Leucine-rich repeat (LRR) protein
MGVTVLVTSKNIQNADADEAMPPLFEPASYSVVIYQAPASHLDEIAAHLGRLNRISNIALSETKCDSILRALPSSCVRSIDISGRKLEYAEVQSLCRMQKLSELIISGGEVDGEGLLSTLDMSELELLSFQGALTDKSISRLASAPRLKHLVVIGGDLSQVSDSGWREFGSINRLESLKLSHLSLSPECKRNLSRMQDLKSLDLSFTDITDDDVALLAALKSLEQLYVGHSNVTSVGYQLSLEVRARATR